MTGSKATTARAGATARTRLGAAAGAVTLAVMLAVAPLAGARLAAGPLLGLGVAGVLLVAAAWRHAGLATAAVVVLVAEYGVSLYGRGGPFDGRAPLFAAGYLLLAELASWSREAHPLVRDELPLLAARIAVLGATGVLSLALAALVLLAAALPLTGAVARLALGLLGAVGAVAVAAALATGRARRATDPGDDHPEQG
jgi:hypothetical protein